MTKFSKRVFRLILITSVLIYLLASGLNFFFKVIHKRNKTDISGEKFDVVFFGSSRTIHHINPEIFNQLTQNSSLNMGWSACNPSEIYAATKIYLSQNYTPKVIAIQLDLEHNLIEIDELAKQGLLKYIGSGLIDDYFSQDLINKSQIPLLLNAQNRDFGWREILKTVFKNNIYSDLNKRKFGYVPIMDTHYVEGSNKTLKKPEKLSKNKNIWIEKTLDLCKKQKIKVILFVSPYYLCKDSEQFEYLRVYKQPIFNFSDLLVDKKYFRDQSHLNYLGADSFTRVFSDSFNNLVK